MKTLVLFVFTTFFIISFVDCHTTTMATTPASTPGNNLFLYYIFNYRYNFILFD